MEEDILNFSPTVMFRGTPCTFSLSCGFGEKYDSEKGGGQNMSLTTPLILLVICFKE